LTSIHEQSGVALVSMPFAPLFSPSIGLGLLKAGLQRRGISARDFYFTFGLAERIGTHQYLNISNGLYSTSDLLGEWIFSRGLFGPDDRAEAAYIRDVLCGGSPHHQKEDNWYGEPFRGLPPEQIQQLLSLRDQEEFLSNCADQVLAVRPTIVGFTSVFQQQLATLSLAKRLKAREPGLTIILGGANCEGAMGQEIVRQFPFVDAVVSGEGDLIFPDLVESILRTGEIPRLPGVYARRHALLSVVAEKPDNATSVTDMDMLPEPDYAGYFAQFEDSRARLSDVFTPHILFETSRGCYWGKVQHCTFCGLNGASMAFRSKSAERAMRELLSLTGQYPGCPVTVVDNILDMQYFQTFIPDLGSRKLDLQLFYEVKSNLRKDQVRLLRDAGIRAIQPGIESLSTPILRQMKKGCTSLQNIQLLKWCKEYGVKAIWNILWKFPGEPHEEYSRMAEIVPRILHLDCPQVAASIRLDRFSPHFDQASDFGFRDVLPYPAYFHVYPGLNAAAVANLAYYFTSTHDGNEDIGYTRGLLQAVQDWRRDQATSDLFAVDLRAALLVWDLRPTALRRLHILTGLARELYLACDGMAGAASLKRCAAQFAGAALSFDEIQAVIDPLVETGLMLREDQTYLALAISLGEYRPGTAIRQQFTRVARQIGRAREDLWHVGDVADRLNASATRPAARADMRSLGPEHFGIDEAGRVLVDLDAVERIDLNSVRAQLSGVLV
jgi:ribosomal peptide maturation radical SAM protein 1